MVEHTCSFCNGQLATVKGALICINCGLINKTALENKESYLSPAFFHERKLRQERDNTKNQNFVNRIKNEIAYLANYLNLSSAIEKQAYLNIIDILKIERIKNPDFPFHTLNQDLTFNCLVVIGLEIASLRFLDASLLDDILAYFESKGETITIEKVKKFNADLITSFAEIENLNEKKENI